jgi:hypothetical protein
MIFVGSNKFTRNLSVGKRACHDGQPLPMQNGVAALNRKIKSHAKVKPELQQPSQRMVLDKTTSSEASHQQPLVMRPSHIQRSKVQQPQRELSERRNSKMNQANSMVAKKPTCGKFSTLNRQVQCSTQYYIWR